MYSLHGTAESFEGKTKLCEGTAADVDDSTVDTALMVCETLDESGKSDGRMEEEVDVALMTAGPGVSKHPTSKADLKKMTSPDLCELTDPNGNIGLPT